VCNTHMLILRVAMQACQQLNIVCNKSEHLRLSIPLTLLICWYVYLVVFFLLAIIISIICLGYLFVYLLWFICVDVFFFLF